MSAWRLLLTHTENLGRRMAERLGEQGVMSCRFPVLAVEPLMGTMAQRSLVMDLDRYAAVIVVSRPAASQFLGLLDCYWPQPPVGVLWLTVGAGTAGILKQYGLPACCPDSGDDSEALLRMPQVASLLSRGDGQRALIVRGEGGRELLADTLRAAGIVVDYLPLYRRVCPQYVFGYLAQVLNEGDINGVVVSSGQGLEYLCALAQGEMEHLQRMALFVPSPRTAALARERGFHHVVDCRGASWERLLEALQASGPGLP